MYRSGSTSSFSDGSYSSSFPSTDYSAEYGSDVSARSTISSRFRSPGSISSEMTPSLRSDISTVQSRLSSMSPRPSSRGNVRYRLVINHDDATTVSGAGQTGDFVNALPLAAASLPCPFPYLNNCTFTTDDFDTWDTHCQAHFRGQLPPKATCPIHRCQWSASVASHDPGAPRRVSSPYDIWNQRAEHIRERHFSDFPYTLLPGHAVEVDRRASTELCQHLWNSKVISNEQYKQLLNTGRIGPSVYLERGGGSRAQRRRAMETSMGVRNGPWY